MNQRIFAGKKPIFINIEIFCHLWQNTQDLKLHPAILLGLSNLPTQTYRLEVGGVTYQVSVAVPETVPSSVPSEQSNNEEDETKRKWDLTRRREDAKNGRNCRRECRVLLSGIKPCRSFFLQLPDTDLPPLTETRTYTHDPPGCGVSLPRRKETKNYNYNAIGNTLLNEEFGAGSYTYASKPHAVTSANGKTYGYDACGNMTNRNGMSLLRANRTRI